VRRRALGTALLLALGCASTGDARVGLPEGGAIAVAPDTALAFAERAEAFYTRLIRRRFNALETFNDAVLRRHFRSVDLFFDYYATLASDLGEAHFEKSRPDEVQLLEFVFTSPSEVLVEVRFVGNDDRPLRPDSTDLVRIDRWEKSESEWWVAPAKL
jgi:hypothetical protein